MLFEDEFVADADDPRLSWRFCLSPIFPPFRKIIKIAIRKFKISKSSFLLVFFFLLVYMMIAPGIRKKDSSPL